MAFSSVKVSHTFQNADGTAGSGSLTFTLTGRMTNGGTTIIPTPVSASLDSSGHFQVNLAATDDAGTTPTDVMWQVTLRVLGAPQETYVFALPSADSAGGADLGALLPSQQQVG